MITIHATTRIAPESRESFVELAAATIADSLAEDGCITYTCAEDLVEPGAFRWVEVWRDLDAFNAHAEARHHVEFIRALSSPDGPRRNGPAEGAFLESVVLT
ncbi:MAG: putative quinol monooxygenase, partial [Aeromicrobium sp.]